ncbi:MAG: hypothetical protein AYL29_010260 [Candidatus Bathyarchaeota archaeon B24]|nr:MAG: hypothetical protein AYL29_010260 [Candidatus Bathyarchaeota archaeon B24]RLI25355.1 MAG: hypothetical protein DRO58_06470 [Candidatus Bathyarchaeota archaeon]RLI26152.1 MAG: hypothetical protein DRO57_01865 [Candidatus Bathyarchaeota archaeon]
MARLVMCPRCGHRFSLSYARLTSCSGCRYSVFGECGYVRCPYCGHEFPLSGEPGNPGKLRL